MFGSTVGFSRSADRMALFPVSPNPRWWRSRHLEKFKWRYLRGGSSDLLRVWFEDVVFGVGGSNGANSGLTKFNSYVGENNVRVEKLDWSQSKVFLVVTKNFASGVS